MTLTDVGVGGKWILSPRRRREYCPYVMNDVMDDRLWQRGCGEGRPSQTYDDGVAAGGGFRLYSLLAAARGINRPRSAPACSIAVRISVSISFSETISPDTACETLTTVANPRFSTVAAIVPVGRGTGACSYSAGVTDRAAAPCRRRPRTGSTGGRPADTHARFSNRGPRRARRGPLARASLCTNPFACAERMACSSSRSASSARPSMRRAQRPRGAARFSKFAEQFSAHTSSCPWWAVRAFKCRARWSGGAESKAAAWQSAL